MTDRTSEQLARELAETRQAMRNALSYMRQSGIHRPDRCEWHEDLHSADIFTKYIFDPMLAQVEGRAEPGSPSQDWTVTSEVGGVRWAERMAVSRWPW